MNNDPEWLDFLKFSLGARSPYNLVGKLVLAPLVLLTSLTWFVLEKLKK